MGNALVFDTHAYVKKLLAVGFTEEQAEVQAETLSSILHEELVTREYLDTRLGELELRLRHDLTLRLGGMMVAGIALVATLVRLL